MFKFKSKLYLTKVELSLGLIKSQLLFLTTYLHNFSICFIKGLGLSPKIRILTREEKFSAC